MCKEILRITVVILMCLLLHIAVNGQSEKKMNFRLNAGVTLNRGPVLLANHMRDHNFDKTSPGSSWLFVTPPTDYPVIKPWGFSSGFEFSKLLNGYGIGVGFVYAYHGSTKGRAESVYLNQGVEMTAAHYIDLDLNSLSLELFYETRKDRAVNIALGSIINYHWLINSYHGINELNHSLSLGLKGELIGSPFWKGMGLNAGGILSTNARIEKFTSYNGLPRVQDVELPKGRINLSYIYAGLYYGL